MLRILLGDFSLKLDSPSPATSWVYIFLPWACTHRKWFFKASCIQTPWARGPWHSLGSCGSTWLSQISFSHFNLPTHPHVNYSKKDQVKFYIPFPRFFFPAPDKHQRPRIQHSWEYSRQERNEVNRKRDSGGSKRRAANSTTWLNWRFGSWEPLVDRGAWSVGRNEDTSEREVLH